MSAGDSSRPGASPSLRFLFENAVFEVRAGGRGHLAFAAEREVAQVIADVAVERLGERVAVVWNGAGESVYRAGASVEEVAP